MTEQYFEDNRGYNINLRMQPDTVRTMVSYSHAGVVRGLHLQLNTTRTVHVLSGKIRDYVYNAETGKCFAKYLTPKDCPKSFPYPFAHGFIAVEPSVVLYEFNTVYNPSEETIYNILYPDLPFSLDMLQLPNILHTSMWLRSQKDTLGIVPSVISNIPLIEL